METAKGEQNLVESKRSNAIRHRSTSAFWRDAASRCGPVNAGCGIATRGGEARERGSRLRAQSDNAETGKASVLGSGARYQCGRRRQA